MSTARLNPEEHSNEIVLVADDFQDTVTDTNALTQTISSDGEAPDHHQITLEEIIEIRPTANVPSTRMRALPLTLLLLRYSLANCTSNDRNPDLTQPWGSALDWGALNPGREAGIGVGYLISSDIHDVRDRLHAEGRGYIALGLLVGTAKMLAASIPSVLLGFGMGALMRYFENEIESRPVLKVFCSPPVSRVIAALVTPWPYIGTRMLINRLFPAPVHQFNATPPLHPIQRTAMVGFRIYDATMNYEFLRIILKAFAPEEIIRNEHFPFGVALMDQLLVNVIDPLAFGRHSYDGAPPFENQVTVLPDDAEAGVHTASVALLDDANDAVIPSSFDDFELYRGEVFRGSHTEVKNALWYSTRTALALAAGFTVNLALSRLQEDKEALTSSQRLAYTAAICTATVLTNYFFEPTVRWVGRKISSCWASLFSGNNDASVTEAESLLVSDDQLAPAATNTNPQ